MPAPSAPVAAFEPDDGEPGPIRIAAEPVEALDPDGDDLFVDLSEQAAPRGTLANVCGVKFREAGTVHEFDAGDASYARGEQVIVESDRGLQPGIVAVAPRRRVVLDPLRRVLRRASADDRAKQAAREEREVDALKTAREEARARRLPMKVVRVELGGQGRALVYFASEERLDFRDLARALGGRLRGRVELRQVGARDEAKMVGGIGDCGRELCCSTFLPAFAPVSIKMAKDQGLVLNPSRVTGRCGRLKCCLVYEHALYQELKKGLPKVGKRVNTPAGEGRVVELDVLRRQVRVGFPFESGGGTQTFPADAVSPMFPPGGAPAPEPEPDPEPDSGIPSE